MTVYEQGGLKEKCYYLVRLLIRSLLNINKVLHKLAEIFVGVVTQGPPYGTQKLYIFMYLFELQIT